MKIKLTRNIGINGKHTPIGTIVDAPYILAMELIGGNRAVAVAEDSEPEVIAVDARKSHGDFSLSADADEPAEQAGEEPVADADEPAKPTRKRK